MWDLKPDAPEEIRGTFRPISTAVPGIQISEHLPRSARLVDKFALVRSVHHATANHPAASYWMMVGSPIARAAPQSVTMSREDRPHPGSVLARLQPGSEAVPSFVMIPEAISPVGPERPGQHAGFLGAAYDPYRINSDANLPGYSAGALSPRPELPTARLSARRSLLRQLARQSRSLDQASVPRPLDPNLVRAFDLVSSSAAQHAFDINAEPDKVRERYGRHTWGQSHLLARKCPFVQQAAISSTRLPGSSMAIL